MNHGAAILLSCCLALGVPAIAQGTPTLVADLNTTPISTYGFGNVRCAAQATTFTCFLTNDEGALTQLWRTDGTSGGTLLLATIHAYTAEPLEMVARNGLVFFTAPSTNAGVELWVSDGTALGTMIRDCNPGAGSSSPRHLMVDLTTTSTRIWFSATDAVAGRELWTSDGGAYPATTRRVYDLNPGTASSMLATDEIQPTSNGVYFAATNGSTGREPWNYTSGAPTLVANIMSGSGSSNPANFVGTSTDLLFTATGPSGTELYRWNTSTLTLIDVRAGTGSSFPSQLVLHYPPTISGRYCFFAADDGSGIGRELWRYNLLTGTRNSYDLEPGSTGSDPELAKVGSTVLAIAGTSSVRQLFGIPVGSTTATLLPTGPGSVGSMFVAFTTPDVALVNMGPLFGVQRVYHTDGTAAGTVLDADFLGLPIATLPGGASVLTWNSFPGYRPIQVVDDQPTSTPAFDLVPQIGATDGSMPTSLTDIGGGVVMFSATTASGPQIWRSDGTAPGTFPLGIGGTELSPPLNGRCYSVRWNGSSADLYATDGTVAGTGLVAGNVCTTAILSPYVHPRNYTILGSRMLITLGETLIATEGTAATTVVLQQSPYGLPMLFGRTKPVVAGSYAYFAAGDAAHGIELWRTDGTAAGTQLFFDVNPGPATGLPYLVQMQWKPALGAFLFYADDGVHGYEPWRSDGTGAGTSLVKDIVVGAGDSIAPNSPVFFDDDQVPALFEAGTPTHGIEPWLTDGTTAGTFLLVDATPGPNSSTNIRRVGRLGGTLIVGAGPYLLETQGTVASTSNLVNQASLVCGLGVPAFGDLLVPTSHGLWRTNGTVAGTTQLSADPVQRAFGIPQGTRVLASIRAAGTGEELWRSDGTVAGTQLHAELRPGTADAAPESFVFSGGKIFFVAEDGIHGRELYVMTSMAGAVPYGAPCAGSAGLPDIAATTPVLGGSFDVSLSHARPNTLAVLVLGLDSNVLPLGGGCSLLVSTVAPAVNVFTVTSPNGTAAVPTAIPNSTAFEGLLLNAQYAVFDQAGAYRNLLALTAAVTGVVGR